MSANDDFSLHDDEELSLHDDASLNGSVPASNKGDAVAKPPQIITTNTLSNIKLPVLQKDDYDTWAMEMEHYLEYIDNEVWKVIQNGTQRSESQKVRMSLQGSSLTTQEKQFGGNANSKKMQKAVLKQQFEAFTISSKESLEKGYDRFQKLLSQLDALGAGVSDEDAKSQGQEDIDDSLYGVCVGEQGTVSDQSVNDDPIPIPFIEHVTISTQKTQPQVPKPQQTVDPSCAQHVKTPRQPIRTLVTPSPIHSYNRQNWNQGMERDLGKAAFLKSTRVVHANVRQATPAWTTLTGCLMQIRSSFLKFTRQHKTCYTFDMKNVASSKDTTCILANASSDEAKCCTGVRSDNGTEFKNRVMLEFCGEKGSKEVIDIDVHTEEAADLMVVSSTSLTEATRKADVTAKIAKKKTNSPKQPSSTPISKSADDIMTFRKELDALALKHLGPVPTTVPTSTNPINTGSSNLNTAIEEVNTGNTEAISPSADHEEEDFSDIDDDEMPEIRIYDKYSEGIFEKASYDDDGIISDFNNLPDEVDVPTNHTLRIYNAHPQSPNTLIMFDQIKSGSVNC
ncbi:hypothetical protein Tco_0591754 [Tanacetum coccineum]